MAIAQNPVCGVELETAPRLDHEATGSGTDKVRVLVVADHATPCDKIRSVLDDREDIVVLGEVANDMEAITKVRELLPDVVHIAMPQLGGVELTSRVHKENPAVKIVWTLHRNGAAPTKMWVFEPTASTGDSLTPNSSNPKRPTHSKR